jgi:hypothetical protein
MAVETAEVVEAKELVFTNLDIKDYTYEYIEIYMFTHIRFPV